jgi:integrase/recombinase XerC
MGRPRFKGGAIALPSTSSGHGPGLKFCPKCETWKEATTEKFPRNNKAKDGLCTYCKLCHSAYYQERRQNNPERVREIERESNRRQREKQRAEKGEKKSRPLAENINPLLAQHVEIFLTAKGNTKSYKTHYYYSTALYVYCDFAPTLWPPTPESIEAFLYSNKQRGLKDSSIRGYYKALKIWLAWLVKRGKLTTNPINLVDLPPAPKLLPRAPKQADLQKFFDYLRTAARLGLWQDIRALALWSLAFDTGLRVGELAALAVKDVSDDGRAALVRGQKTYTDRMVFFSESVATALAKWLEVRATLPLPPGLDSLFVALNPRSELPSKWRGFTTWGMREDLTARCHKAGCSHLHPHALRHGYAVYSIRNHADLLDVQRQLGHSNIATTSRYLLVDDEGRAERHDTSSPFANLGGAL